MYTRKTCTTRSRVVIAWSFLIVFGITNMRRYRRNANKVINVEWNIFQQSRSLKETVDTYNNDIYVVLRRNGGKFIFSNITVFTFQFWNSSKLCNALLSSSPHPRTRLTIIRLKRVCFFKAIDRFSIYRKYTSLFFFAFFPDIRGPSESINKCTYLRTLRLEFGRNY